ncbi:MAG: HAD family phosphatase [Candidatus Binatia bacterium]
MPTRFGVIFDMDGVLVDSADAHRRAWEQLGAEVGVPFSAALFERTFGQRNAEIIPAWLGAVTPRRSDALGQRKEALYRDMVRQGRVHVYRGASGLLAQLRQVGACVAVASSGPRENVALLIDTIGAGAWITVTVAAEDVHHGKPHPEIFLTAATRMSADPGHCAVVEDSVHGIEAAKRAGMLAVAVLTSTARERLLAAGADSVAAEVGDLDPRQLRRTIGTRMPTD